VAPTRTPALIPFLKPLYDYSWAVGLVVGFLAYLALTMTAPSRQPTATHAATTV
jgi:nucleobase:cation symporter-1, NCS1 family